jgi:transposase
MADVNDDAMGGYRRIEVLTGPGRRRQWSAEQKAQIVAESLVPGAIVTDVARRWQVCPQQVFGWRRQARAGLLALPAAATGSDAPMFVPIVTEAEVAAETPSLTAPASMIEVTLAGAVIRIPSGVDGALLTSVLQAVRASASAA